MRPARKFLAFDLETTGLDVESDRIVEFCFIQVDEKLKELARWGGRVNPGRPIPPAVSKIHGIKDLDVKDKPGFAHHAARVQSLVSGSVLIAHNGWFDAELLHRELIRADRDGLAEDQQLIDTLELERLVNSHTLQATYYRYTGHQLGRSHSAEADAEAAIEILRGQLKRHPRKIGPTIASLNAALEVSWLDHSKRFYVDDKGIVRFGFGKYKGENVADYVEYLEWMLDAPFEIETKTVATDLLRKAKGSSGKPAPK